MNILVTGGAGYIGSHACLALAEAGHTPIVYDNLSTGHHNAVQWGPFVQADLADYGSVRQALRDYGVEAVIHFAASAYVGESVDKPRKYYENNTRNTLTLLGAMLDEKIGTIIFSSTCATYGTPERLPITENTLQRPINPYGRSKLFVEKILADYHAAYGLQYAALRYFNVAGSDPLGRIGETHEPETHIIPLVIGAALGIRPAIKVFGTDYATPDGSAVRDYIHVMDLVDAHIQALYWLLANPNKPLLLNLGTERGASVLEVIGTAEHVLEKPVPTEYGVRRTGDPAQLIADSNLARELLGWQPQYSLEDSVRHTAAWLKKTRANLASANL